MQFSIISLIEHVSVVYYQLHYWTRFQTTKEEFDCEARNIMTEDQVRLHNDFLLCLFNKVRGLAAMTPTCKIDRDKTAKERRLRLKRKYKTDKSNFEVYSHSIINVL